MEDPKFQFIWLRGRLNYENLTDDRRQVMAKMWKVYRVWIQSVDNTSYDHLYHHGRSSIEIAHFVLIHLQTLLPQAILVLDWSISVLRFLEAEWKVSDTGSALWASSLFSFFFRSPDTNDRCFVSFAQAVSEIFRNRQIRNKNRLWCPCMLMDRDEMSNRYRGPPIEASYQVPLHLAKRFQKRFLKIDQSETRIQIWLS
jgi:hypothetical protein